MKQLRFLLNPLLLVILVVILITPFIISEGIVRPAKDLGRVAGFRTVTNKDLAIYPNYTSFDGYVSFSPTAITNGRYSDQLTLTSFRGQIAIYHQLYTIYNDADLPIILRLSLDQPPLTSSFNNLILDLHLENEPACTSVEGDCRSQTIFVQNEGIINRESQILSLAPGASAQITATLVGLFDTSSSTSTVSLDISLLANFAE